MNAFFNIQFNYRLLIWILHSRQNNNKVKHSHERCLRLIHNYKLLGIKIDSKLRFDDHIQNLCNKANRKLRAY